MAKLVVHRAGASDKNEGSPKPYADTQRRQGYTNRSQKGQGGTLFGGKTPGQSNRSGAAGSQRTKANNGEFLSGARKVMPNNTLFDKAEQGAYSEKPPRLTFQQSADLEQRARSHYDKQLKDARRNADKKRLKKRFNGSDSSITLRRGGWQNS